MADTVILSPAAEAENYNYTDYRNPTYSLVSIMAYLIGVEKDKFKPREEKYLILEEYERLDKLKSARIIRNLCRIRTGFEKNYSEIRTQFMYQLKNIGTLPELIPSKSVDELARDGITLFKSKPDVNEYLIAVNREMSKRINGIKTLFPEWLKWEYIRDLFIMSNGLKVEGLKQAGLEYNQNRNRYPYQCYINWIGGDEGNILHCDEKFVTLLYQCHEDYFENTSLVRDAGNITKANIYDFLVQSDRTIFVVDCENSDPIKLAAALSGIPASSRAKIVKVLLFDSDYTTTSWRILAQAGDFPIEHMRVERLNEKKSQVDMTLATRTCKEVYTNGVDSVVLVSSDSDYWALIKSLADIDFLVMVEKSKCGRDILDALEQRDIFYCFLDDFCTSASYAIKTTTLLGEIAKRLDAVTSINMSTMLDEVIRSTWVQMTPKERQGFYDRYIKPMRVSLDAEGNLKLLLGE